MSRFFWSYSNPIPRASTPFTGGIVAHEAQRFKTRTVVSDGGGGHLLLGVDSLPIDQFIVDLGTYVNSKSELPDIETEFFVQLS